MQNNDPGLNFHALVFSPVSARLCRLSLVRRNYRNIPALSIPSRRQVIRITLRNDGRSKMMRSKLIISTLSQECGRCHDQRKSSMQLLHEVAWPGLPGTKSAQYVLLRVGWVLECAPARDQPHAFPTGDLLKTTAAALAALFIAISSSEPALAIQSAVTSPSEHSRSGRTKFRLYLPSTAAHFETGTSNNTYSLIVRSPD